MKAVFSYYCAPFRTFTMKAGQVVEEDIAPSWSDQSEADKSKWKAFARQVTGLEPCEEED